MRRPAKSAEWALVALITLGAAALRLTQIGKVPPDPFYDAAVRSMSLSWHNFFFGAFEPGASVSIDKPPVDLWLQVISVKLLGFTSTTLKLPEALAGIASVPLLYAAVSRVWGTVAGIVAAIAIAVLPVEVITSRSDTMDGVMMVLLVIAFLLIVRATETGKTSWLLAGAGVLGIAFDVKLLESLVALPGLALLAFLGLPGNHRRKLAQVTVAGVLYVAIALAWLTATLIPPHNDRPYAIGSTNGSAWNAAFVFNGKDRLSGKSPEPQGTVYEPGHRYPVATQSERDHIPILPPSATRLLARYGPLSGERLGMELLIGLLLGIPALIAGLRSDARAAREEPEREALDGIRVRRAAAVGLTVWLATGIVLFSHMARLHPRYVEGFTPAVAAMMGVGMAWAVSRGSRLRPIALAVALVAAVYYTERLLYGRPATWWIALVGALVALALTVLALLHGDRERPRSPRLTAGVVTGALVAVLAVGLKSDITAIGDKVSDAGFVGQLPGDEQRPLSIFLRAHQDGARYEVAAESATQIGSLIVQDARPIVVLTTYDARVYTSIAKLEHLIAEGKVRYAFLNTFCGHHASAVNAACSAPAQWIRQHGTDVSRDAGLPAHRVLWLLPGAHR
jgi:4-amino-4-deoxy-L-arabinose transferase-like glycosyltransferase